MDCLRVSKAHAYGNDFLLIAAQEFTGEPGATARALCDRKTGVGGDGVILFELRAASAVMRLFNADGGAAELSGNGLRCLAALVARLQNLEIGATISVQTDAGPKSLKLIGIAGHRYTFRAALGPPLGVRRMEIPIDGEAITATVMSMGNPQCVVLGPLPALERFSRLGPALSTHPMFPGGTNVEFAHVERPDQVRILIWERGVGPTSSSGTGTSAAAVAAALHGGANRDVEVVAPGGAQRVEWRDDGVYLTGWAQLVMEGTAWLA